MKEYFRCRKCKRTYMAWEQTGPSVPFLMGEIERHTDSKVCSNCGGEVIWVDENGRPLSAYKRQEEAEQHLRRALIWGAVAIIGVLLLYGISRALS